MIKCPSDKQKMFYECAYNRQITVKFTEQKIRGNAACILALLRRPPYRNTWHKDSPLSGPLMNLGAEDRKTSGKKNERTFDFISIPTFKANNKLPRLME